MWEVFERPTRKKHIISSIHFRERLAIQSLVKAGWTKKMIKNFLSERLQQEIDNHF